MIAAKQCYAQIESHETFAYQSVAEGSHITDLETDIEIRDGCHAERNLHTECHGLFRQFFAAEGHVIIAVAQPDSVSKPFQEVTHIVTAGRKLSAEFEGVGITEAHLIPGIVTVVCGPILIDVIEPDAVDRTVQENTHADG